MKAQIEKKIGSYVKHANKGKKKKVIFEPGDWVWVHMRKERFPSWRKSKLQPRGDSPFQVLSKIIDNAYKIDLLGEHGVSNTFNVSDLCPFDVGDEDFNSRSNSLKEWGDDENQAKNKGIESIQRLGGPMTRACAKKSKEVLNQMVATLIEAYSHLEGLKPKLVNYIKQLEEIR